MIKSTFQTLKKNPKVILVFALLLILSIVITVGPMLLVMPELTSHTTMDDYDNLDFFTIYFKMMGIMILGSLIIGIFVTPAIGNYVYEVCAGKLEKGWYKRGLKRGWWKVVVLTLIWIGVLIGVAVILAILVLLLQYIRHAVYLVFILYFVIGFTFYTYMFISLTAIMAEDKFSVALVNIFKIGNRYFFRFLGTAIVVFIPTYVASFILSWFSVNSMLSMGGNVPGYWIIYSIICIYGVFAIAFISTYSMNQYLNKKSLLDQEVVMSEKPETMQMESNETACSENTEKIDE